MSTLPTDIIFNILSRLPVKSLVRFRCVSKLLCEYIDSPYFANIHSKRDVEESTVVVFERTYTCLDQHCIVSFCNIIVSEEGPTTFFRVKKEPFVKFKYYKESLFGIPKAVVHGSCNGLLYLSQDQMDKTTSLVVINPLRKECYDLPPMNNRPYIGQVHVSRLKNHVGLVLMIPPTLLKWYVFFPKEKFICEKRKTLIVLGKIYAPWCMSWAPIFGEKYSKYHAYYPIFGDYVFAHGCLYWMVNHFIWQAKDRSKVIYFDVKKEEFGLINQPPKIEDGELYNSNKLVDLHGEVGYAYERNSSLEVWILKEKEWVVRCRIDLKPYPYGNTALGRWKKDGNMLVGDICRRELLFVYGLKSGLSSKANIVSLENNDERDFEFYMYRSSISSMHACHESSTSQKLTGAILAHCCGRGTLFMRDWSYIF